MANSFFQFKLFTIHHDRCAMKVTTDACLFGAWVATTMSKGRLAKCQAKLLDIGAGTGLLSMMVAQKTEGQLDAIEIDADAAAQAGENTVSSPWKERITIIHSDVLHWKNDDVYNCIFSNPPFYENELKSSGNAKNIAHHGDGLKMADLLSFIKNHLEEDGQFFLLLPAKREKELEAVFLKAGLFVQQKVHVQQTLKHQPFRLMIQGRRKEVEQEVSRRIVIKNESDEYTPEFIDLLKDYYLYL